jgi:hypothetical protein
MPTVKNQYGTAQWSDELYAKVARNRAAKGLPPIDYSRPPMPGNVLGGEPEMMAANRVDPQMMRRQQIMKHGNKP